MESYLSDPEYLATDAFSRIPAPLAFPDRSGAFPRTWRPPPFTQPRGSSHIPHQQYHREPSPEPFVPLSPVISSSILSNEELSVEGLPQAPAVDGASASSSGGQKGRSSLHYLTSPLLTHSHITDASSSWTPATLATVSTSYHEVPVPLAKASTEQRKMALEPCNPDDLPDTVEWLTRERDVDITTLFKNQMELQEPENFEVSFKYCDEGVRQELDSQKEKLLPFHHTAQFQNALARSNYYDALGIHVFGDSLAIEMAFLDHILGLSSATNFGEVSNNPTGLSEYLIWRSTMFPLHVFMLASAGYDIELKFRNFNPVCLVSRFPVKRHAFFESRAEVEKAARDIVASHPKLQLLYGVVNLDISPREFMRQLCMVFLTLDIGGDFVCRIEESASLASVQCIFVLLFSFEKVGLLRVPFVDASSGARYIVCKNLTCTRPQADSIASHLLSYYDKLKPETEFLKLEAFSLLDDFVDEISAFNITLDLLQCKALKRAEVFMRDPTVDITTEQIDIRRRLLVKWKLLEPLPERRESHISPPAHFNGSSYMLPGETFLAGYIEHTPRNLTLSRSFWRERLKGRESTRVESNPMPSSSSSPTSTFRQDRRLEQNHSRPSPGHQPTRGYPHRDRYDQQRRPHDQRFSPYAQRGGYSNSDRYPRGGASMRHHQQLYVPKPKPPPKPYLTQRELEEEMRNRHKNTLYAQPSTSIVNRSSVASSSQNQATHDSSQKRMRDSDDDEHSRKSRRQ